MKPLQVLGQTRAADGTELVLYHRDGSYQIRVNGLELMTSRSHGSEEELARLACSELPRLPRPHVLIGGLGMGFTLRAALDALPSVAVVEVAEVFPAVVGWCRGPLAHLAGRPLEDPRVSVLVADVVSVLEAPASSQRFAAIVLVVDNGPEALSLTSNQRLYRGQGIANLCRALCPGGSVAVWSADPDPAFARRLRRSGGLAVSCTQVRARRGGKGPQHTIILGRKEVGGSTGGRRRRSR